jgi:phosphoglycerol transferase MdoB-like AlkP superfamily enzyme
MDEIGRIQSARNIRPRFFTVLMTVTNHARFNKVPESQRYLYPKQKNKNKKQYYANSLRVTDEYLKTFFQELRSRDYLKNSVVIITGDHSFPVGEHGNYDSESGFYNEYFRTPLLIWGKGITPRVVREPHSQLDIAPTVLELTGISATVHFKGDSVFSAPPPFIPLIQPYAGGNIGVLSYPYKYVYNKRSQREYLFNIADDPSEKNNITETADSRPLYESLRRKAGEILLNDRLVKENRIWDRSRER